MLFSGTRGQDVHRSHLASAAPGERSTRCLGVVGGGLCFSPARPRALPRRCGSAPLLPSSAPSVGGFFLPALSRTFRDMGKSFLLASAT